MTRFAKLFLIAALAASPAMSFAQDVMKMSNDELSAYYKNEMSAIEDELKANKKRQKNNAGDTSLKAIEQTKRADLEALKMKKKLVDAAITAEKESQKAQKKAQDAREDEKEAENKKNSTKQAADIAIRTNPNNKTYEEFSDQFKNEISAIDDELKANKKRQKANPTDASLKTEAQSKKAEQEDLKARKKAVDAFIKAASDLKKAQDKAKATQQDAEDAIKVAKQAAEDADRAVGRVTE